MSMKFYKIINAAYLLYLRALDIGIYVYVCILFVLFVKILIVEIKFPLVSWLLLNLKIFFILQFYNKRVIF